MNDRPIPGAVSADVPNPDSLHRAYERLAAMVEALLPHPLGAILATLLAALDVAADAPQTAAELYPDPVLADSFVKFSALDAVDHYRRMLTRVAELPANEPKVESADPRSHDRARLAGRLHALADEIASGARRAPARGAGAVRQLSVQFGNLIVPVAIHDVLCGWRVATDQAPDAPGLLVCAGCGLGYRAGDVKGSTLARALRADQPEPARGTHDLSTPTTAPGAFVDAFPTADRSGFDVLADLLTRAGDGWAAEAARLPHVRILARGDEHRRDTVEVEGVALLYRSEAAPHGDGRWHVLDWGYAPLAQLSRDVPLSEQRGGGRS